MDIRELSALELGSAIKKKEISCREAAEVYLKAIGEKDGTVGAYITVLDGSGEENTAEESISQGENDSADELTAENLTSGNISEESNPTEEIIKGGKKR